MQCPVHGWRRFLPKGPSILSVPPFPPRCGPPDPLSHTKVYTSPENIACDGMLSSCGDLWALGCTVLELVSGAEACIGWSTDAFNRESPHGFVWARLGERGCFCAWGARRHPGEAGGF